MNIEEFRACCLSFEGVREKMPFGKSASDYDSNILVFTVAERWFCFVNIDVFDFCNIKYEPVAASDLRERYAGVRPGWHMNKRHWISVDLNGDVPDDLIRELIRSSYERVLAGLPRPVGKTLSER